MDDLECVVVTETEGASTRNKNETGDEPFSNKEGCLFENVVEFPSNENDTSQPPLLEKFVTENKNDIEETNSLYREESVEKFEIERNEYSKSQIAELHSNENETREESLKKLESKNSESRDEAGEYLNFETENDEGFLESVDLKSSSKTQQQQQHKRTLRRPVTENTFYKAPTTSRIWDWKLFKSRTSVNKTVDVEVPKGKDLLPFMRPLTSRPLPVCRSSSAPHFAVRTRNSQEKMPPIQPSKSCPRGFSGAACTPGELRPKVEKSLTVGVNQTGAPTAGRRKSTSVKSDVFQITPPGYDSRYQRERTRIRLRHVEMPPAPVVWDQEEQVLLEFEHREAVRKCSAWLSQHL